jgi:5-formyltetrahydrofolate cyclo-ligase
MGVKIDMSKVKMTKKKSGRRKARSDSQVCADRYSTIDISRVCTVLGLIPIPENVTVPGLVDLWNTNTDYYLPRLEDQEKELRVLSKPKSEQEDERGMWAGLLRTDSK